jgi:hypothetical protein
MDADLLRMKTFIEKGHPPRDAASPLPPDAVSPLPAGYQTTAHNPQMSAERMNAETAGQQSHLAGGR